MSDIEKAIVKILNSEELFKKLCEAKTLEDAYNFCISVHGGYTLQEFEEFLENIDVPDFEKIDKEINDKEINLDEKIGLDEKRNLNNISGGKRKSNYNKALAVSLSMITIATPIASAAQATATENKIPSSNVSKKGTKEVSFWRKYKRYFAYAGVAGGAAALLFLCYFVGVNWPKDEKANSNSNPLNNDGAGNTSSAGQNSSSSANPANSGNSGDSGKDESPITKFITRVGALLKEKGQPIAIMGTVLFELIDRLASLGKKFSQISGAVWPVSRLWSRAKDWKNWLDNKIDSEEINCRNAQENLEELLKTISGQEKAKKQIKTVVNEVLHKRDQAKFNGVKYAHGDVLYFAGPSGVGKTLMAAGLAKYKVLSNTTDVFTISASEVDKESPESVVEQLFGMSRGYSPWSGGFGMGSSGNGGVVSEPKNLVKYLNQNRNGVVIINEYDKMWSPALDEVFRTIIDNGVVSVKGQTIDCSGITFILTSNESAASLKIDDPKPDNTGSRTEIHHDKSFLNRLHPIEFDDLSIEDYKKIIDKEIRNDVVNYWSNPEVVGMNLVIDDECLENMAKVVKDKNQGARYIDVMAGELFSVAMDRVNAKEAETGKEDYYKGKKVYVSYDPNKEEFTLTDEDEKK